MKNRARITNEELKELPSKCFPFNTGGAVIIHKSTLQAICDELVTKRENQEKLIKLLEEADEYSDRLEWKVFFKDLPNVLEEVNKRFRNEDGEIKNG